jgi:hypothetical protein
MLSRPFPELPPAFLCAMAPPPHALGLITSSIGHDVGHTQ